MGMLVTPSVRVQEQRGSQRLPEATPVQYYHDKQTKTT